MSNYFDLAIACDIKLETPGIFIDAIRYLTDPEFTLDRKPQLLYEGEDFWLNFEGHRFLAPDPEHEIISSFRPILYSLQTGERPSIYQYVLQFFGRGIVDDVFYYKHDLFLFWLATIGEEGFIGYKKVLLEPLPDLLYIRNGRLETTD